MVLFAVVSWSTVCVLWCPKAASTVSGFGSVRLFARAVVRCVDITRLSLRVVNQSVVYRPDLKVSV